MVLLYVKGSYFAGLLRMGMIPKQNDGLEMETECFDSA